MKDKKGFCYEIFKNIAVWNSNSGVSYNPCSFYQGFIDNNLPIDKVWLGRNHKKIIEIVANNDLVPGCKACYVEEASGRKSRRNSSKELYEQFHSDSSISIVNTGPTGLDYSVGNHCNLKCIICGPHSSSAWISDYKKINPNVDIQIFVNRKSKTPELDDDNFLVNLKNVHFHGGGEPLLSDAHIRLLERIDRVKGLGDVRVFYNTNGTVKVDDHVLDLWSRCKLIEIYFSIDDIGRRFEYQRTGASWDKVAKNISWFYHNMPHNHMFNINCVWGYLNLFYLDQLQQWHQDNLPTNRYGDPCNLLFQKAIGTFSIQHLNANALLTLKNKFSSSPDLLNLLNGIKESDSEHTNFWNTIKKIDAVRNTAFEDICPEWSIYL